LIKKNIPISDRILHEDNHLIIVNKQPSEIVQEDKTGDTPLVEDVRSFIKEKYQKPGNVFSGIVHRIDRPVSGAVVFAKTSKGLSKMNFLIRNHGMKKIYWAIVQNKPEPESAVLHHHMVRNRVKNKSTAHLEPKPDSKDAILEYKLIGKSEFYYLLEVNLKTGRHHQIRSQLASIGCPIKGDLKYGFPRSNKDASISLHAKSVKFFHPIKRETIFVVAPTPRDPLWDFFSDNYL
jgi:23S rRNA pseudouridine1911/1915/1917 synthase